MYSIKFYDLCNYLDLFTKENGDFFFLNPDNKEKYNCYIYDGTDKIPYFIFNYLRYRDNYDTRNILYVDFSDVNFDILTDKQKEYASLIVFTYKQYSIVAPHGNIGTGTEIQKDLNRIILSVFNRKNILSYIMTIDLDYLFSLNTDIFSEIDKCFENLSNVYIKSLFLIHSDLFIDMNDNTAEIIYYINNKCKEFGITLAFNNTHFNKFKNNKLEKNNRELELEFSSKIFCKQIPDELFDGYTEFYTDYDKFQEIYDKVLNYLKTVPDYESYRFSLSTKASDIVGIEELFAWITVTTGIVFIFYGSYSTVYFNTIDEFIKTDSNILPAYIRLQFIVKSSRINKYACLGVTQLRFGTEDVDTLVSVDSISYPIRKAKCIKLDYILSEISTVFDNDDIDMKERLQYDGFYIKRPIFQNQSSVVKSFNNLTNYDIFQSTYDIILDRFISECRYTYKKLFDDNNRYYTRYSVEQYPLLLEQYLYCFQSVFSYYMNDNKMYYLNDIFILKTEDDTLYAAVAEYETNIQVRPIDKVLDKMIIGSSRQADIVKSPRFLVDYQLSEKTESGYDIPVINPIIKEAISYIINNKRSDYGDNLMITQNGDINNSNEDNEIDVYEYLYPVVNSRTSLYYDDDTYVIDDSLSEELSFYFKEMIMYSIQRNSRASKKINYNDDFSSLCKNNPDNCKSILKQKIIHETSANDSNYNRNTNIPNLFKNNKISYNNLRYLLPKESPIMWNGLINGNFNIIPPTLLIT